MASAREELANLPPSLLQAVDRQILALADNPQPPEARVLSAEDRLWYLSVESYRVVYQFDEDRDNDRGGTHRSDQRILIVKIAN